MPVYNDFDLSLGAGGSNDPPSDNAGADPGTSDYGYPPAPSEPSHAPDTPALSDDGFGEYETVVDSSHGVADMGSNWLSSLYDIKSTLLLAAGAMAVMICVKFFRKDDSRLPWIAIWCLCAFIAALVLALKLSVTQQELVTCTAVFVTMLLVTDKNKRIEDPLFGWVLPTAVFIGFVLFYGLL